MQDQVQTKVLTYINSHARNKVIFYRETLSEITPIDMGRTLAQAIYNLTDDTKLSIRVTYLVDEIANNSVTNHPKYGRSLAISNLGILLEPGLKQDFAKLLEKHSNNNVLFVRWKGEIENGYLYFLSKEKGVKINISNLSHIAI
jgi:hypothetical protein